jgi:hypothetical protein
VNSFNLLRIDYPRVAVERHTWDAGQRRFTPAQPEVFERGEDGWRPVDGRAHCSSGANQLHQGG